MNFHISTRAPRLFHRIFITTPRASVDFIEFAPLLRAPLVDFIVHTPTHAPRLFHRSFTTPPRAPPSVTQNLISVAWWLIVNVLTPEQRGVFCRTLQVDPQGGNKNKRARGVVLLPGSVTFLGCGPRRPWLRTVFLLSSYQTSINFLPSGADALVALKDHSTRSDHQASTIVLSLLFNKNVSFRYEMGSWVGGYLSQP